jgi:hypothetical protein
MKAGEYKHKYQFNNSLHFNMWRAQIFTTLWMHHPHLIYIHTYIYIHTHTHTHTHQSQWPCDLRCRSADARLLRSWVRIQPGAWLFVCCECCVLSGRGLCDKLITHPEESYRLWRVVVCDLETRIGAPYIYIYIYIYIYTGWLWRKLRYFWIG